MSVPTEYVTRVMSFAKYSLGDFGFGLTTLLREEERTRLTAEALCSLYRQRIYAPDEVVGKGLQHIGFICAVVEGVPETRKVVHETVGFLFLQKRHKLSPLFPNTRWTTLSYDGHTTCEIDAVSLPPDSVHFEQFIRGTEMQYVHEVGVYTPVGADLALYERHGWVVEPLKNVVMHQVISDKSDPDHVYTVTDLVVSSEREDGEKIRTLLLERALAHARVDTTCCEFRIVCPEVRVSFYERHGFTRRGVYVCYKIKHEASDPEPDLPKEKTDAEKNIRR